MAPELSATAQARLTQAIDLYDAGDTSGCGRAVQQLLQWAAGHRLRDVEALAHLIGARRAVDAQAFEDAARHVGAAQRLARELGNRELLVRGHSAACRLYVALGDYDQSTLELDTARPLVPESGLAAFEFLEGLVNTQASMGQIDDALLTLERLQAVADDLALPRCRSQALGSLAGRLFSKGWAQKEAGEAEQARLTLERSVALGRQALHDADRAGARRQNVSVLNNLGGALASLGRWDEALDSFARHRRLAQELGLETTIVNALLGEARVRRRLGQTAEARALAQQGIERGERQHARRITAWLHRLVSELDEDAGDLASALAHFKQHAELLERHHTEAAAMHARVLSVRLETERAQRAAQAEHEHAEALQRANRALELRAEILSREAMQDALTGLANRRRIDQHLAGEPLRPAAGAPASCVALLDVDHFKQINDRHSHAVGDLVLMQLAALIARQCREGDLPARYGGEEFLVRFDRIGLGPAAAACERLRAAVEAHDWSALAPGLAVTVSIGVVDLSRHASAAEALAAADERMYRAKREGRNRVCADLEAAAPPAAAA